MGERARAHFQPLGERASRGYNAHTRVHVPTTHTYTCTRMYARPTWPGLPSSFKGLTDDRHGTERRRVRIHHIFYVPPLVYPSLSTGVIKREPSYRCQNPHRTGPRLFQELSLSAKGRTAVRFYLRENSFYKLLNSNIYSESRLWYILRIKGLNLTI